MQHQFTYACQPFYGNECCQASSHQLTLRKNTTHEQPDSVMIYPEWNVNGICQEPGVERTTQVTSWPKCSKTMAITPFIAEKPTSVLKALPEPTR